MKVKDFVKMVKWDSEIVIIDTPISEDINSFDFSEKKNFNTKYGRLLDQYGDNTILRFSFENYANSDTGYGFTAILPTIRILIDY
jgi:hypothetical protein